MTETRLDWKPVVRSLVARLMKNNIIPTAVYDGAYTTRIAQTSMHSMAVEVAEAACAVDECSLRCIFHDKDVELHGSLLLVFGNDPDELVADYSWQPNPGALVRGYGYPKDSPLELGLNAAIEEFEDEWQGKPCPRVQEAA